MRMKVEFVGYMDVRGSYETKSALSALLESNYIDIESLALSTVPELPKEPEPETTVPAAPPRVDESTGLEF